MKLLAFGSNRDFRGLRPKLVIERAYTLLEEYPIKIVKKSRFYQTLPFGFVDDHLFINSVIEIKTELSALRLLDIILNIEKSLGRIRLQDKNKSRTLDIDILIFEELIRSDERLIIPHPRMWSRDFVLTPLSDIVEQIKNPLSGEIINLKPYSEKIEEIKDEEN